jgi:hypothetical protein
VPDGNTKERLNFEPEPAALGAWIHSNHPGVIQKPELSNDDLCMLLERLARDWICMSLAGVTAQQVRPGSVGYCGNVVTIALLSSCRCTAGCACQTFYPSTLNAAVIVCRAACLQTRSADCNGEGQRVGGVL